MYDFCFHFFAFAKVNPVQIFFPENPFGVYPGKFPLPISLP